MKNENKAKDSASAACAGALVRLAALLLTVTAPVWMTSQACMPFAQKTALIASSMLLPTDRNGPDALYAVSDGDIVYPRTDGGGASMSDVVPQEQIMTTAATESTAAAETASTEPTTQTEQHEIPSGMKPVIESRLGDNGLHAGGIYVKNGAGYDLNIEKALTDKADCRIKLNAGYQVLIIHTHTTECYAESDRDYYDPDYSPRTADKSQNVIAVGEVIAKRLEKAGIRTLHVTTIHDYPQYNGSYNRAAETIAGYLEKYPSIEMVIDVHRDAITHDDGTKVKPTCEINGKKAAQVMIITGCDNHGKLEFPEWRKNLTMAAQLQKELYSSYGGLMRPLYFAPFRYNMHMTPNSLLIEFGTDVNTLDEALYSASMVGEGLTRVLERYVTND